MKWISLLEARPPWDKSYAMRLLSRDMYWGSDDILKYRQSLYPTEGELIEIRIDDEDGHTFPTKVVEWLDESPINEEELMRVLRKGFGFDDACEAYDEIVKILQT